MENTNLQQEQKTPSELEAQTPAHENPADRHTGVFLEGVLWFGLSSFGAFKTFGTPYFAAVFFGSLTLAAAEVVCINATGRGIVHNGLAFAGKGIINCLDYFDQREPEKSLEPKKEEKELLLSSSQTSSSQNSTYVIILSQDEKSKETESTTSIASSSAEKDRNPPKILSNNEIREASKKASEAFKKKYPHFNRITSPSLDNKKQNSDATNTTPHQH